MYRALRFTQEEDETTYLTKRYWWEWMRIMSIEYLMGRSIRIRINIYCQEVIKIMTLIDGGILIPVTFGVRLDGHRSKICDWQYREMDYWLCCWSPCYLWCFHIIATTCHRVTTTHEYVKCSFLALKVHSSLPCLFQSFIWPISHSLSSVVFLSSFIVKSMYVSDGMNISSDSFRIRGDAFLSSHSSLESTSYTSIITR